MRTLTLLTLVLAASWGGPVGAGTGMDIEATTWCKRDPGYERAFSLVLRGDEMFLNGFRLGRSQAIVDRGAISVLVRPPGARDESGAGTCPSSRCVHRISKAGKITEEIGCLNSARMTKLLGAYETLRRGKPLIAD